jgi:hypothetical protein
MVSENAESITRTVLVWARQLAHYAEVKNAGAIPVYLVSYCGYLKRILRNNGQMALVLHLKVALFALYSYVSGNPLTSTYALGSPMRLDRRGLPLAFGRKMREIIASGSLQHIRLMASLLNIYRAMEAPHKAPDISSITKPHPNLSSSQTMAEFKEFCAEVLPGLLRKETGKPLTFKYESGLGLIIRSAGANNAGPAMGSIARDARAWANAKENHVLSWFNLHDDEPAAKIMTLCSKDSHFGGEELNLDSLSGEPMQGMTVAAAYMATRNAFSSLPQTPDGEVRYPKGTEFDHLGSGKLFPRPILGRLHAIDEPAGKVRVVAICDYWTQVSMKPVHDHLFEVLKNISTDATFDQSGIVTRYFNEGLAPHWSFDLKAATDTIPLALYIEVMTVMLRCEGETSIEARQRAELWAKIMTDREFLTPLKEGYARYGTGQPMGALSSWASMALVHHALVQFSHWRVTKPSSCEPSWFKTYLVLGDDVDIAQNALVAKSYQDSCAELAIVIGLLKSLHSKRNCFEFANRRFSPDGDISPLSLKEELASNSWIARLEYAKRILARFGTSYSPGFALLRKATTVSQWQVLIPELSGTRSHTQFLDAVRFLLENPFTLTKDLGDIPVGQYLSWVMYLLPKEDKQRLTQYMADSHQIARFGGLYAHRLLQLLDMEIQKALNGLPSPNVLGTYVARQGIPKGLCLTDRATVSNISYNTKKVRRRGKEVDEHNFTVMMPKTIPQLVTKLEELNAPRVITYPNNGGTYISGDGSSQHYDGSVTLLYNQFCFNKHNEKYEEELNLLKRRVILLKCFLPTEPTTLGELFAADRYVCSRPELKSNTILGAVLNVWTEFTGLSKAIVPNFSESINTWLPQIEEGPVPYIEILHRLPNGLKSIERILCLIEERTRGPIRALGYAMAKEFGIIIPSLHNMAFEKASMKGNSWLTLVRQWRKDGTISRLFSGTATTIVEQSEVLARAINRARKYWLPIASSVTTPSLGQGEGALLGGKVQAPDLGYDINPTTTLS